MAKHKGRVSADIKNEWERLNMVPDKHELCIEEDTNRMKLGDGLRRYNDLVYLPASGGAPMVVSKSMQGWIDAGNPVIEKGVVAVCEDGWLKGVYVGDGRRASEIFTMHRLVVSRIVLGKDSSYGTHEVLESVGPLPWYDRYVYLMCGNIPPLGFYLAAVSAMGHSEVLSTDSATHIHLVLRPAPEVDIECFRPRGMLKCAVSGIGSFMSNQGDFSGYLNADVVNEAPYGSRSRFIVVNERLQQTPVEVEQDYYSYYPNVDSTDSIITFVLKRDEDGGFFDFGVRLDDI